jgi:ankyrin repeat protein
MRVAIIARNSINNCIGCKMDTPYVKLERLFKKMEFTKAMELLNDDDYTSLVTNHQLAMHMTFESIANNHRALELLINHGADVNAPSPLTGHPEGSLASAASSGSLECVAILLRHGAKVNHIVNGKVRCSALTGAAMEGSLDIVKMLVEHGADLTASWAGQNALSIALLYGKQDVADYLRSVGMKMPS